MFFDIYRDRTVYIQFSKHQELKTATVSHLEKLIEVRLL